MSFLQVRVYGFDCLRYAVTTGSCGRIRTIPRQFLISENGRIECSAICTKFKKNMVHFMGYVELFVSLYGHCRYIVPVNCVTQL